MSTTNHGLPHPPRVALARRAVAPVRRAAPPRERCPRTDPADGASPSQLLLRNERFDRLEEALGSLKPEYREVLRLARIEGLKIKEIAERMRRSPNSVKHLIVRALAELKARPNPSPGDFSYAWDFGDGQGDTGVTVEHAYNAPGDYRVRLTFSDGLEAASIERVLRVDTRPEPRFIRGDCNDDGELNISDVTCMLNWLFAGAEAPDCIAVANTNGDDGVNIADVTYLLGHLFGGGPPPAQPHADCGPGALRADAAMCEAPPARCR